MMSELYACIDDLIPELAVELPGATPVGIATAFGSALREFLSESAAWRVELDAFSLYGDKSTYYLDPPTPNSLILYVHGARFVKDGASTPIHPLTQQDSAKVAFAAAGDPRFFHGYADYPGRISIYPTPAEDTEPCVIPTVSLTVAEPWDRRIPLFVLRYWRDVLFSGTVGRMMNQQDKPYSNANTAVYHLRKFRAGIVRARDMAGRQYTTAEHIPAFPRWA